MRCWWEGVMADAYKQVGIEGVNEMLVGGGNGRCL